MSSLLQRISNGEVLLCDGAMGTLLMERGLERGACPEAWNLTHPERLIEIAREYIDAGVDIVQTNTFGGTRLRLAQFGLESHTEEINRNAVRAARSAAGDRVVVGLSCGPTGRRLKPAGETDPDEVFAAFERQIRAGVTEGIDAVFIETMSDLDEAVLAVKAARSVAAGIPVIATMTFGATAAGFATPAGVTIAQTVVGLTAAGADMIGSNCGDGIDNMVRIAREFRGGTTLPLAIQSNAGLPRIQEGRAIYPESPGVMASRVDALLVSGVSIIGGCCGTTPAHIAAFRRELDRLARH